MGPQNLHREGSPPAGTDQSQIRNCFSRSIWRESVIRKNYGLECQFLPSRPFLAEMRFWCLGTMKLARMRLDGHLVSADRCVAHSFPYEYVYLQLISGGAVEFDYVEGSIVLGPGSMVLFNPASDFRETFSQKTDLIMLTLPKRALRERGYIADTDQPAIQDTRDGDVRILSHMIMSLAHSSESASPDLRKRIGAQLFDLMDVLVPAGGEARLGRSQEAARIRVKCFARRHLGDPDLSGTNISARIGLSSRHINRLFEAEGTSLMRFLNKVRVERAREMLADSSYASTKIEEIAQRCGFRGAAQFCRSYKRHYGLSPRDHRVLMTRRHSRTNHRNCPASLEHQLDTGCPPQSCNRSD